MPFQVTWSMGGGCDCPSCPCVKYVRNQEGVWVALEQRPGSWQRLPRRDYDPSLGATPPGCGVGYENLVQAAGGRTKEYPHGQLVPGTTLPALWCNESDAEAWAAQTHVVAKLVRAAWNALIAAENKAQDWQGSRALSASVTAYEEEHASLPAPSLWMAFGSGGCAEAVASMIANIESGACQLDQLNRALEALGAGGIPVPYTPPPSGGGAGFLALGGLAGVGLAIALVFLLAKR